MAAVKVSGTVIANSLMGMNVITLSNKTTIYVFVSSGSPTTVLSIFKSTDSGATWNQLTNVTFTTIHGGNQGYIDAALDTAGYIHVISSCTALQTRDVAYAKFNTANDTWSAWEQAANLTAVQSGAVPYCGISIDSNNKPHIIYMDYLTSMGKSYNVAKYTNKVGASWLTPETVSANSGGPFVDHVAITLRYNNIVEVQYSVRDTGSSPVSAYLYKRARTTSWGTETLIFNFSDSWGTAYFTWDYNGAIYATRDSGGQAYHTYAYYMGYYGYPAYSDDDPAMTTISGYGWGCTIFPDLTRLMIAQNGSWLTCRYTVNGETTGPSIEIEVVNITRIRAEWAYNAFYQYDKMTYIYDKSGENSIYFNTFTPNFPPEIALDAPADGDTLNTANPDFDFTGTDPDGDKVEYQIQIDLNNTFDSQAYGWNINAVTYVRTKANSYGNGHLFISEDGVHVYTKNFDKIIYQQHMTTAWDISTLVYDQSKTLTEPDDFYAMFISPDGFKLFVGGYISRKIYQYSLSTAWDISTATYVRYIQGLTDGYLRSLHFDPSGTYMFQVPDNGPQFYRYTLSQPWDISTATQDQGFHHQQYGQKSQWFSPDGLCAYSLGCPNSFIYEYRMAAPWDLTTMVFVREYWPQQDTTQMYGMAFNETGTIMVLSGLTSNSLYQYSITATLTPLIDQNSVNDEGFTVGAETHPFTSGSTANYIVQAGSELNTGVYYWRVRTKDPGGTNMWSSWSSIWHIHLDVSTINVTPESPVSFKMSTFIGGVPIPPLPVSFKMSAFFTPQRGAFGWASFFKDLNSVLFITPQPTSFKTVKISPSVVLGSISITPGMVDFSLVKVDPNVDIFMPSITLDLSSSPDEFSLLTVDPTVVIEEAQVYFGVLKVWTGSQWMPKPMMVYKGGLWVNAVLKRWEDEWLLVDTGA